MLSTWVWLFPTNKSQTLANLLILKADLRGCHAFPFFNFVPAFPHSSRPHRQLLCAEGMGVSEPHDSWSLLSPYTSKSRASGPGNNSSVFWSWRNHFGQEIGQPLHKLVYGLCTWSYIVRRAATDCKLLQKETVQCWVPGKGVWFVAPSQKEMPRWGVDISR